VAEELGDLLLQVALLAQIAAEEGRFRLPDVIARIVEKLIRRHPHVFADGDAKTPDEVKARWDEIKRGENRAKGATDAGLLDKVPRVLPALMEAQQLTSRAASVGFDWEDVDQVLLKLDEELKELAEARKAGSPEQVAQEMGDLLFVLVNLSRRLKVDAEQALRGTNTKFRRRFGYLERKLAGQGRTLEETPLAEMDRLWDEAKGQP
jgi:MazG family protein